MGVPWNTSVSKYHLNPTVTQQHALYAMWNNETWVWGCSYIQGCDGFGGSGAHSFKTTAVAAVEIAAALCDERFISSYAIRIAMRTVSHGLARDLFVQTPPYGFLAPIFLVPGLNPPPGCLTRLFSDPGHNPHPIYREKVSRDQSSEPTK